jgi:hypothetical protein
MAVACSMLIAACTRGPDRQQPSGSIQVDGSTRRSLQVGGTGEDHLTLRIDPGDIDGPGSITTTVSEEPAPTWPWFAAAGQSHDIQVQAKLANPLTLSFAAGARHRSDLPLVLYKAGADGWYPVAVGDPGGATSAERTSFSPYLAGWADPARWFDGLVDIVKRLATERTTPPVCTSQPPSWAQVIEPTLDILLTCTQTNVDDKGVQRVELMLKNNRGLTQEITIPPAVAYAAAEDQPESIRAYVRRIAGGGDVVLLPPGKWLTIGFTRPASTDDVVITPRPNALTLSTDLLLQLGELADERGGGGLVTALVILAGCTGLKSKLPPGTPISSQADVERTLVELAACVAGRASDPKQAVAIAQQVVALLTSKPLLIVSSDQAFNPRVQKIAGKLLILGKAVKVWTTAQIAKLAFTVWDSASEELGRGLADNDPASVRLTLTAAKTLCVGAARCRQVATADVDGDRRPDQIGVVRLADSPYGQQNWALRVLTARGRLGAIRQGPDTIYGEPFFGAAEIDGVPGAELLMRMSSGPHSQWFRMYTWRGTRLTVERNPEITDGYQDYGWVVDSAISEVVGLTCDRSGGRVSITSTALTPTGEGAFNSPGAPYAGEIRTWRWSAGRWLADGTRSISVKAGTPQFNAIAGWHCLGLPRGTG